MKKKKLHSSYMYISIIKISLKYKSFVGQASTTESTTITGKSLHKIVCIYLHDWEEEGVVRFWGLRSNRLFWGGGWGEWGVPA